MVVGTRGLRGVCCCGYLVLVVVRKLRTLRRMIRVVLRRFFRPLLDRGFHANAFFVLGVVNLGF